MVFEVAMQNAITFSYLQSNWCHIFIQNHPIALIDNASVHPITMDTKWHEMQLIFLGELLYLVVIKCKMEMNIIKFPFPYISI